MMRLVLRNLFVSLVVISCWANLAYCQQPRDPLAEHLFPPEMLMQHAAQLGLSEEQRQAIQGEVEKLHEFVSENQNNLHEQMAALAELLKSDEVQEKAIVGQLEKVLDAERKIKLKHLATFVRIRNQLTNEQREKAQSLKTEVRARGEDRQQRLHQKLAQVKRIVDERVQNGEPPHRVVERMQAFPKLMEQGKVDAAEQLLDSALEQLRGRN